MTTHALVPFLTSSALAGALVASCWQAVALTAAVALAFALLPALSAATRAAVWTVVLSLVLGLPFAFFVSPHTLATPSHALHVAVRGSDLFLALWAGASAFRLAQLAMGALRLRTVLRHAVPVPPSPELAGSLAAGTRHVRLCTSEHVEHPSVAGFLHPRILVPPALLQELTTAELQQVVLHECAHLRRRDDWINLLQQVALVLLPLNPALLWVNRRLSLERELACDDRVLAAVHARKAYAACLARVAEHTLLQRGVSLALGILDRRPELVRRVERILRAPRPVMGRRQSRLATGALLAGLAGGACVLAHSPELVTFSAPSTMPTPATTAMLVPVRRSMLPAGTAHEVLAHALVPMTAGLHSAPLRPAGFHRAAQRFPRSAFRAPRRLHAGREPHLLLTQWHGSTAHQRTLLTDWRTPVAPSQVTVAGWRPAVSPSEPPPAFTPAVRLTHVLVRDERGGAVWYTAVSWRDGWLVLQL